MATKSDKEESSQYRLRRAEESSENRKLIYNATCAIKNVSELAKKESQLE